MPLRVSWSELLRLSASAAVMNAVVPLALAAQIALTGRLAGVAVQAAFGLVTTTTGLGTIAFNFLVDGVTAKVGKSVGARRWDEAAGRARMALLAAVLCGCAASGALLAARRRLFALFGANDDVSRHARLYFLFRAAAVPLQCVASSANGCLGGYRRVHAATALGVGRASLEVVGVALALAGGSGKVSGDDGSDEVMLGVGLVYVVCVAIHACVGVFLVAGLVPDGAPRRLRILGGGGSSYDDENDEVGGRLIGTGRTTGCGLSEVLDFVSDGASMLIRSLPLQGSLFAVMVVASRELGAHGLAAHHVVCQLWMVSSYLVDGLATAGTVLGSRLVGAATKNAAGANGGGALAPSGMGDGATATIEEERDENDDEADAKVLPALRSVCHRLLLLGLCAGCVFAASLTYARDYLIAAFTSDPTTSATLRQGSLWRLLAGAQPLNALVFVYDGLIYAFQEFGFVRELMEVGVGYVFLPALAWGASRDTPTLAGLWAAKVALNAWRAGGLAIRIHGWLLTERGLKSHARKSAWETAAASLAAGEHSSVGDRGGRGSISGFRSPGNSLWGGLCCRMRNSRHGGRSAGLSGRLQSSLLSDIGGSGESLDDDVEASSLNFSEGSLSH